MSWNLASQPRFAKAINAALLATLALAGCARFSGPTSDRDLIDPKANVAAAVSVGDSFSVVTTDKTYIVISKAALEKEFLLQGALIDQTREAAGNSLKSRVVAFRERAGKLYMLEATQGHVVTNDLPSTIVLAQFPIISEDDKNITFDFNAGMSNLFVANSMYGEDDGGKDYSADKDYESVHVRVSFIESAKVDGTNLVIRQIAQLETPKPVKGTDKDTIHSFTDSPEEVRYFLAPYHPDQAFVPVRSNHDMTRMGFFETSPAFTLTSDTVIFLNHFDPKKPIVYAVSSNTPPTFRQAVKDGVLYWNKILGPNAVQVIDAPAGVTAPDINYNVIQWIPDETSGAAYADASNDPRSGQVLHAQVFLPSVFGIENMTKARLYARRLQVGLSPNSQPYGLSGLLSSRLCSRDVSQQFNQTLASLVQDDAKDDAILRFALAQVREVTAHEVGHTLGMRHNFAGSLAVNYPQTQRDTLLKGYLQTKTLPAGLVGSSSMMEYEGTLETSITGEGIPDASVPPLAYDKKALEFLYQGKEAQDSEIPFFCTDSDVKKFGDCQQFDSGRSLVEATSWLIPQQLKTEGMSFVDAYVSSRVPLSGQVLPIEKVTVKDPVAAAKDFMSTRVLMMKQLTTETALIAVQRLYPQVSNFDAAVVRDASAAYLAKEDQAFGGLATVLAPIPTDLAAKLTAEVATALQEPNYRSGLADDNRPFTLTDADAAKIQSIAATYYTTFEKQLILRDLKILSGKGDDDDATPGQLLDAVVADELAPILADRIRQYAFATTGETITETISLDGTVAAKAVSLPKFKYPLAIRLAAANLFGSNRSLNPVWGLQSRVAVRDEFKALTETAIGGSLSAASVEKLPADVARWVIENQQVSSALQF